MFRIFRFRRMVTIAVLLIIAYGKSHAASSVVDASDPALPAALPLVLAALALSFGD